MKLANIVPNDFNNVAEDVNDMHLLLMHWAAKSVRYTSFYRSSSKYKILDNSFYELHKVPSISHILIWADVMKVQEVVAPDKMYDYMATKKMVKEFIRECKKVYPDGIPFKIQAVVCGKTKKQLMDCYTDYMLNEDIDVIAFSRRGCKFDNMCHDDARYQLVNECTHTLDFAAKPIHLLGANGIKDYYRVWPDTVRSIDSKQLANTVLGLWGLNAPVTFTQKLIFKRLANDLKCRLQ